MTVTTRFVIVVGALVGWGAGCASPSPELDDATPSIPVGTGTTETTTSTSTTTSTTSTDMSTPRTIRLTYGPAPEQFGDLTVPSTDPAPVVVLVHGGFWRNPYDLGLMEPLARDLVDRGYAVWNIEYRRLGDLGGGWPGTLTDVADAIDHLTTVDEPIDLGRIAIVGHSAGGHLALWAAGRRALPAGAPGADPAIEPTIAIGQGAVVDLDAAADAPLGNGAAIELLGGTPSLVPDRYALATPVLSAGPSMVSVVGTDDDIVPPAFSSDPDQPSTIEVVEVVGADHFDLIDPGHEAWTAVVDRLDTAFGR